MYSPSLPVCLDISRIPSERVLRVPGPQAAAAPQKMTSAAAHAPTRALLAGFAAVVVLLAAVLAAGGNRPRNVHAGTGAVKPNEGAVTTPPPLLTPSVGPQAGERGVLPTRGARVP